MITTFFELCLTFSSIWNIEYNEVLLCSQTLQGSNEIASCKTLAGISPMSGKVFVSGHHRKKQKKCSLPGKQYWKKFNMILSWMLWMELFTSLYTHSLSMSSLDGNRLWITWFYRPNKKFPPDDCLFLWIEGLMWAK